MSFDEFPLCPDQLETLKAIGYHTPSPIQAAMIPEVLKGSDVIGQARTGTGKTASFLIPLFAKLDDDLNPQVLVLVPTRELAQQVVDEAIKLSGQRDLRIAAVYGGESMEKQKAALRRGARVVVGTPGRIIDMLQRTILRTDTLKAVVLDEADRMLDIGFRPDIEKILRRTPSSRQTMLLSATMPPPVLRLAQRYMRDPVSLNLSNDEISVESIEQRYITVDEDRKLQLLLRLLVRERPRQCLIFCQTKVAVERLTRALSQRIRGVMEMRGDLPQGVRNRVMKQFREETVRILVATDVVGRGIDVQNISHVINYDVPEDPEAYVHRVGRTGRMGKDGKAFTLVTPEQGRMLTTIEVFANKLILADEIENFVAYSPRQK